MNSSSRNKGLVRRCRPLLGTYVEIAISGLEEKALHRAIDSAFRVLSDLQQKLSAHDPASEISRLNGEASRHPVRVSRETFVLLRRAHQLSAESEGAFDYTVGPLLARWGLRPPHLAGQDAGTWRDVKLEKGRWVSFRRPLAVDLGGIAKGFAVDRAVGLLRGKKVLAGLVNAGGDLRVFGAHGLTVQLRHPADPQRFAHVFRLTETALATSSPCFTERSWRGQRVSHLVDPIQGAAITGKVSVTVRARECWLADALTKVVLNAPRQAERLLAACQAEAYVFSA